MAVHIDWTDAAGTALLAQSDDVLDAVQVMRAQAINSGALVSSPEVTVSTDPESSAVVVQPAKPSVVYVPQYDPQVVYAPSAGDALATGLVVFGTVALISEIFDDDDDWHGYWGCRDCGGWGGVSGGWRLLSFEREKGGNTLDFEQSGAIFAATVRF